MPLVPSDREVRTPPLPHSNWLDNDLRTMVHLLEQQLGFFGKLVHRLAAGPMRHLVCNYDFEVQPTVQSQRRGRPKLEWSYELHKIADEMFESAANFRACVADATAWRAYVRKYCRAKPL